MYAARMLQISENQITVRTVMTGSITLGNQHYRRAVPLSINLSARILDGGNLEIREREAETLLADIPTMGFGDALLFRIAQELEHRVADVHGQARTVHVGWFHRLVQDPTISR